MTRHTTEPKTKRSARRSPKWQLANVIIRHMWADSAKPENAVKASRRDAA